MKRYRVIYNQDCTNLFSIVKEPIKSEHVITMVDEVAEGGADLMLINPNGQKTNFPGRAWETFWENCSDMPHAIRQMKRLADQGYDYLKLALGRCREKNMARGVSIRMNDMHGALEPDTHFLNSTFYKQHPEYRLPGPVNLGWGRTGLNYEHEEVRLHYLKFITEIVEKYDFDVLELDFMRFPNYFPFRDFDRHCVIMTKFIRQVRDILQKKQLYIRIASTPAAAYELCFDLKHLKNIVDGITFTEFLNTGWEMPVEEFRKIVGKDIALYAGADVSADRRPGLPVRYMPHNELLMKGFAYAYLNSGADGVYLFNFFTLREHGKFPGQLRFDAFRNIKSVNMLKGRPKAYLITSNISPCCETDLVHQVPVNIDPRQSKCFEMLLGEEPKNCKFLLRVVFTGNISCEQLWLRCNQMPAGSANLVKTMPVEESSRELISSGKISGSRVVDRIQIAEFLIPNSLIHSGRNYFILRNEAADVIIVHGLEMCVFVN